MATKIIPVGTVFGRWTVIAAGEQYTNTNGTKSSASVVLCVCGNTRTARNNSLKRGKTNSCGCLHVERMTKDGFSAIPEYDVLRAMIRRCTNPKDIAYLNCGGRGITVCERWMKFENFIEDMGQRPTPRHSIDRINNDGNYEPENCRWETRKEQSNNTSRNVNITFYNKTMTLSQWAAVSQVGARTVTSRLRLGWTEKAAVWTPVKRRVSCSKSRT